MSLPEAFNLWEDFLKVRLVLVRLQRFGAGQFGQQLLRLVDQNGQALRANVSCTIAMR